MTWFFLALIAPCLYAFSNHIDKHLLEKYFKHGGVGTLLIFSALMSALVAPVFYIIDPSVLLLQRDNMIVIVVVGMLGTAGLWLYLVALAQEEPSVSVVYYQLIPVIAAILGYLLLDESLSTSSLTAMAVILLGMTIMSIDFSVAGKIKVRARTVLYMSSASACWALSSVLFKMVALEENIWRSLFWEYVTLFLVGLLIFACSSSYRSEFAAAFRNNSKAILALNFATAGLYIVANVILANAYIFAPVALVLTVDSFQPAFVILIGFVLSKIYPEASSETISLRSVTQKTVATIVSGMGVWILFSFDVRPTSP